MAGLIPWQGPFVVLAFFFQTGRLQWLESATSLGCVQSSSLTSKGSCPNWIIRFDIGPLMLTRPKINCHLPINHTSFIISGQWGTICDDHFDDRDAAVICRTGGYDGGEYRNGTYKQNLKADSYRILLDDVACRGWERSILECPHLRWGKHNCDHSQDVGIMCYSKCVSLHLLSPSEVGQT